MAPVPPKKGAKPTAAKSAPPKPKSKATKNAANGGQIKTKRSASTTSFAKSSKTALKKKRTYSDKELNLPSLNMITPAGVQKPKGKKKGKVFVDDAESMRTILAMVSADREGKIESKMQKARQMEEIRESRKAEMEKKEEQRREKLERVKDGLRKKKNKKNAEDVDEGLGEDDSKPSKKSKKRVSFG